MQQNRFLGQANLARVFEIAYCSGLKVNFVGDKDAIEALITDFEPKVRVDSNKPDMVIEVVMPTFDALYNPRFQESPEAIVDRLKDKRAGVKKRSRLTPFDMSESSRTLFKTAVERIGLTPLQQYAVVNTAHAISYLDTDNYEPEIPHWAEAIQYQRYREDKPESLEEKMMEAFRRFWKAPHPDHFVTRLGDEEWEILKEMRDLYFAHYGIEG